MADMTPEEWRDHLSDELARRKPGITKLRQYYDERHPFPTAPDHASDTYLRLASLAQTNLCGLIVDSVNDRLSIQVAGPASGLWSANGLQPMASIGHEEALKVGRSFVLVWPTDEGVSITVEDPTECIVAYQPGNRRVRVAALKSFRDGNVEDMTLWLPGQVFRWTRDLSDMGAELVAVPDDRVAPPGIPMFEFLAKPNITGVPTPELTLAVLTVQDRLNKNVFDRLVASEFLAYPQRYVIGAEIDTDEDGNPINPLIPGPSRVWAVDGEDPSKVQLGQLPAADLEKYLRVAEAEMQTLAGVSKTPIFYLLAGLVNVSADAIRALEGGLVSKVRAHAAVFGEAWRSVLSYAMELAGIEGDPQVSFGAPESRSLAELADAAGKLKAAGYPFKAIARLLGATPAEIEQLLAERAEEAASEPAAA